MPYKVYKTVKDRRNHTCGFLIPNGGWYHVVEMTFENYQQLTNISKHPGYMVSYVEGRIGMFDPEGNEVDPKSVEVDSVLKLVTAYEKVGGKTAKKGEHEDNERADLIKQAKQRGITIDQRWSNQRIKEVIERASQRRENSLAVG